MKRDPLNFFQPFEGLQPNHENQLTRALLVLLRVSPAAHERWLTRLKVDPGLHKSATGFRTQQHAVLKSTASKQRVPVLSVFLTPKAPLETDLVVRASGRQQVLDAIIEYGQERVIVVENKVAEASSWQAINLNIKRAGVRIAKGEKVRVVEWPDLLAHFGALLEGGRVAGAEAEVLADFLQYAEDQFPRLGPYHSLVLARGNEFRITRRLQTVFSEASGGEAFLNRLGWPSIELPPLQGAAALAFLHQVDRDGKECVQFSVFPADTLAQARAFYREPAKVEAVQKLARKPGWSLEPNFHFGHFETGYVWCHGDLEIERYLDLWVREIAAGMHELRRSEWPRYWRRLLQERIATTGDRSEFHRCFTKTGRQKASPRPGLTLARRWPMDEAEWLDGSGKLVAEVAKALNFAVAALDP
jgi:hypothetical protein